MRNGRAIGLFLGTHLAAVNPKPQGLTLSDRSFRIVPPKRYSFTPIVQPGNIGPCLRKIPGY